MAKMNLIRLNVVGAMQICMVGRICMDHVIYRNFVWFGLN